MQKISNIPQLGKDLLNVYSMLKSGSIDTKTANGLCNVAGKVISASKVVLAYNRTKKTIQKIELLESK